MYFSHSGSWKFQDQGAIRVGFWYGLSFWVADCWLLTTVCSHNLSSVLTWRERERTLMSLNLWVWGRTQFSQQRSLIFNWNWKWRRCAGFGNAGWRLVPRPLLRDDHLSLDILGPPLPTQLLCCCFLQAYPVMILVVWGCSFWMWPPLASGLGGVSAATKMLDLE